MYSDGKISDPKIFLYLPESIPTINDIENLIQWLIERDLKNKKYGFTGTNLAIIHKENKKIIGWLGELYYSITKKQYSIKTG